MLYQSAVALIGRPSSTLPSVIFLSMHLNSSRKSLISFRCLKQGIFDYQLLVSLQDEKTHDVPSDHCGPLCLSLETVLLLMVQPLWVVPLSDTTCHVGLSSRNNKTKPQNSCKGSFRLPSKGKFIVQCPKKSKRLQE